MPNTAANPWLEVPATPPYVLPSDCAAIQAFNLNAQEPFRIQDHLLPEPFIGVATAPVVLLVQNPGFAEEDRKAHADLHFSTLLRQNYAQLPSAYPFYYLDPEVESPGRRWWERKLKPLLELFRRDHLARVLLCIEYFPYHSTRFRHVNLTLPSQKYGFGLVRSAIDRKALVVLMRGRMIWSGQIPELETYPRIVTLNSWQNVVISPRNCPQFEGIVSAIRGSGAS